jgi:hypothetical protein
MKNRKLVVDCMRLSAALALVGVLCCGTGCESDGKSDSGSKFHGSWALYPTGTLSLYRGFAARDTPYWYVHFKPDKTFFISNEPNGDGVRVTGTYSISGSALAGPFTTPVGGQGRVEATINNGVIELDFIEYWHSPHKVLPFSGTKL